jgi:hypothetical protein
MNTPGLPIDPAAFQQAAIGQRAHAALEAASASLPPDITFRLGQSRARALALHAPRRAALPFLQYAGMPGIGSRWFHDVIAPVFGIVLLALVATTASQYAAAESHNELIELDSTLLADDLPIDAYLDRGFGAWIDHQDGF